MTRWISAIGGLAAIGASTLLGGTPVEAQVGKPAARQTPLAAATKPAKRDLAALPKEALAAATAFTRAPMPVGVSGYGGPARSLPTRPGPAVPAAAPPGAIAPQNYGLDNLSTIYHFSDRLVNPELDDDNPWRRAGRFSFVTAGGDTLFCSASLISSSIMLTAGHCVHQGGSLFGRPKEQGWITAGTYTPAFRNGNAPFGSATGNHFLTTSGWYDDGQIDQGYDVALVVLNKRAGTTSEIGADTGWFGFCHTNCLQPYNHLSQLGFPANYYQGSQMTQSEHLERSNTRDLLLGTGMRGGSSGGPHVANLGDIVDASYDQGEFTARNWVFAVTSWGYVGEGPKLQGASTLSGPGNVNKFKDLFNAACTRARALHGVRSCSLL